MGNFNSLFEKQKKIKVVLNGLDGSGRTTILYKLKSGEVVTTISTVGINVETISFKNIDLTCWDIGGHDKMRPFWSHYYEDTNAVIWVIDSNDRERIETTMDELHKMMKEDNLKDIPLLIFCNKQDCHNVMQTSEIIGHLKLPSYVKKWHIQACSATTGDGLHDGLDWLLKVIREGSI